MQMWDRGVVRDMTPEEIAEWQAAQAPEPPRVPPSISRQQFFRMLARSGLCTPEEALDAARTGSEPPFLAAMLAGLPEEAQTDARILWATAVDFYRDDTLFALAVAGGLVTAEQLDAMFIEAAAFGAVQVQPRAALSRSAR